MRVAILDIDGTIADLTHRLGFIKGKPKDYNKFFDEMVDDKLIKPIARLHDCLWDAEETVIFVSGRPDSHRKQTEEWLRTNALYFHKLYMRKAGDYRPDHIVKKEILDQIRADGLEPWIAIDDRDSIVKMWRENNIPCLQCAHEEKLETFPQTSILTLMVGPSGAGKSEWLLNEGQFDLGIKHRWVIESDEIREDLCGDFRDQSKNNEVFEALHAVAKTRLTHGLPTVIDATHLHRKDRLASALLVPPSVPVRYIVIDRPMAEKVKTGGWRNTLDFDLMGRHQQTFDSQLKDILAGDHLPNVTVIDRISYEHSSR